MWLAALAIMVITPCLLVLTGPAGAAIYVVFLVVCLILGANQRLTHMGADDFCNSRTKD